MVRTCRTKWAKVRRGQRTYLRTKPDGIPEAKLVTAHLANRRDRYSW